MSPLLHLDQELLDHKSLDFWTSNRLIPLKLESSFVEIGCMDPDDQILRGLLQISFSQEVRLMHLSQSQLDAALTGLKTLDENERLLSELDFKPEDFDNLSQLKSAGESAPVIRLVNNLLQRAIFEEATDVHFEPDEEGLRVRYRIDGMLRDGQRLPAWVAPALISRTKIIAELDIAERRLPQDGRIKWTFGDEEMDMRVSSLPTRYGEKVVIRILRQVKILHNLESLGFAPELLERFKFCVDRPQGMLFVTGPTGSGKSSTLHAALRNISHREINITTIEDPIEYELARANQVQVNVKAGLTFATALRSILRQDPDVILVGETRDAETAQIAIQAAQTGHLVLSTLHTNDAASAISRLKDLGIPTFLIASSVLGILAQRLVRTVCPHCSNWSTPSPYEIKIIPELPSKVKVAQGCPACNGTGYKGRMAVFEFLEIDTKIREMIIDGASENEIRQHGVQKTLKSDGLRRIAEGLTTVEEIMRVIVVS